MTHGAQPPPAALKEVRVANHGAGIFNYPITKSPTYPLRVTQLPAPHPLALDRVPLPSPATTRKLQPTDKCSPPCRNPRPDSCDGKPFPLPGKEIAEDKSLQNKKYSALAP